MPHKHIGYSMPPYQADVTLSFDEALFRRGIVADLAVKKELARVKRSSLKPCKVKIPNADQQTDYIRIFHTLNSLIYCEPVYYEPVDMGDDDDDTGHEYINADQYAAA